MEFTNNKKLFRFEGQLPDGEYATLEYRWKKGSMALMHTIVPVSDRGHGTGTKLIKFTLDYVREHHLKIIPYCSFVAAFLKEHKDYTDLVDKDQPA